ncbi:hypothetical protein VF21_05323 [Pseudogymnoascus sp. 05NY08]|nr:hypothetical protein VF21_05323 [Pseudogymnoascus sp. 05NY08]
MGHTTYCCVLCGTIIGEDTETWLDKFRGVYIKENQWNSPRLSGIGVITDTISAGGVAVPLEADRRHDDVDLDPSAVMDLSLTFGHDYGGIMQYFPGPKEHIPGEERMLSRRYYKQRYYPRNSKRDPMEYSDPLNIPSLQEIFQQRFKEAGGANKNNDADEAAWTNETPLKILNPTDYFKLFPTEIVYHILICLPSKDVLNAKLASATFAALPLTNTFWASRFQRGYEFDCVFEAQGLQTKDYDWDQSP